MDFLRKIKHNWNNPKPISITLKKKHIFFGLFLFIGLVLYFQNMQDSPFIQHSVTCEDNETQIINKDTYNICGVLVDHRLKTKDKIKQYLNIKDGRNQFPIN